MTLTELTPLELNKFRLSGSRTPLTPDQIEKLRNVASATKDKKPE